MVVASLSVMGGRSSSSSNSSIIRLIFMGILMGWLISRMSKLMTMTMTAFPEEATITTNNIQQLEQQLLRMHSPIISINSINDTTTTPSQQEQQEQQNLSAGGGASGLSFGIPAAIDWKSWYDASSSQNNKLTIIKMGGLDQSGIGSQICNLIALKIYLQDIGREIAVDTTTYYIQYTNPQEDDMGGHELGFLGCWFTPTFPLIQNYLDLKEVASIIPQYNTSVLAANKDLILEARQEMQKAISTRNYVSASKIRNDLQKLERIDTFNDNLVDKKNNTDHRGVTIMTNPDLSFRDYFFQKYGSKGTKLYQRFATEACANFQFSAGALQEITKFRAHHGIPTTITTFGSTTNISVGFHIRRGDKVEVRESKKFPAKKYVKKLLSILQQQQHSTSSEPSADPNHLPATISNIENCFVATDDYVAVQEIQEALRHHNITCTLYTLTQPTQQGHTTNGQNSHEETLQFMTELSILIETNYFVGTFNSNVGSLVALLRSCSSTQAANAPQHYHYSWGIDRDDWWFR